jgi:hypothetical protein
MTRDGPTIGPFGARFRLVGLVVGRAGLGARFGYDRGAMKGPWPLEALFGAVHRRGGYLEWSRVREIDPGNQRITVSGSVADLPSPGSAR